MGTFCTTTSLQTLMPDTVFNTATSSLAEACIVQSENKIREILSERYDTSADYFQTSTATPPALTTICEWYSMGLMYENLSRGGKDAFKRADRYLEKAMENLKSIVEYSTNLVASDGSIIDSDTDAYQIKCNTTDYHGTFDEGGPADWVVDQDKLDDISDAKD